MGGEAMNISTPENNNMEIANLDNAALAMVKEAEKQLLDQTGQQIVLVAYEDK
jgi:hypothetical protein